MASDSPKHMGARSADIYPPRTRGSVFSPPPPPPLPPYDQRIASYRGAHFREGELGWGFVMMTLTTLWECHLRQSARNAGVLLI